MRSRVVVTLLACAVLLGAIAWVRSGFSRGAHADAGPTFRAPAGTPTAAPHRAAPRATRPSASGSRAVAKPPLKVAPAPLPPPPTGARYTAPPVPSAGNAGAGPVALRLSFVGGAPQLAAPGTAIPRGTVGVGPGSPAGFDTDPLRRPVTIDGASSLRLHLQRSGSGDVQLQVTVSDVQPDGASTTLAGTDAVVPAAVADAGPKSSADIPVTTSRATVPAGDVLRLTVAVPDMGAGSVTLYYGALPGEDASGSTGDQLEEADGGPNPARLTVPVTEVTGAFEPY